MLAQTTNQHKSPPIQNNEALKIYANDLSTSLICFSILNKEKHIWKVCSQYENSAQGEKRERETAGRCFRVLV